MPLESPLSSLQDQEMKPVLFSAHHSKEATFVPRPSRIICAGWEINMKEPGYEARSIVTAV